MKRVERKARTRQALVDAAVAEFGRLGYGGARVERIAEAAGVTTGALYTHFRSKEALFLAVYEAATTRIVDEVALLAGLADGEAGPRRGEGDGGPGPIDGGGRPRDVAGAMDAWLAWHAADPRWFRLNAEFLLSLPDLPAELRDDVVARRRRVRERLAGWLAAVAARRGRRLTVPAEELALQVHALAIGMVLEQIGDPEAAAGGRLGAWVDAIVTGYTEELP